MPVRSSSMSISRKSGPREFDIVRAILDAWVQRKFEAVCSILEIDVVPRGAW